MPDSLIDRCQALLSELNIIDARDHINITRLSGGVASDIAMVSTGSNQYCVKFALPKLKVQRDWFAPVHRNNAEYAWLKIAAKMAPESALTLYGQSRSLHGFAMEFITGTDVYLWKDALLAGAPVNGEAKKVGNLLGRIHAASAQSDFDSDSFENRDDFHALRIEPYILHTAVRHTDISTEMLQVADTLYQANQVLVHGDVSPKNILFRASGPVLLDAECANMGDAAFDPAFCINHLILKAIHKPNFTQAYLNQATEFWSSYCQYVCWEPIAGIESRLCKLLPCLMLARIDGKSPVEYLTESEQKQVRQIARHLIKHPVTDLNVLMSSINDLIHNNLIHT